MCICPAENYVGLQILTHLQNERHKAKRINLKNKIKKQSTGFLEHMLGMNVSNCSNLIQKNTLRSKNDSNRDNEGDNMKLMESPIGSRNNTKPKNKGFSSIISESSPPTDK